MSKVADRFGVGNSIRDSELNKLINRSDRNMCQSLKPIVELWVDEKIRKVVAYEEKTVYAPGCNTCAFEYTTFEVYFKSQEGALCSYQYDGQFADLINMFNNVF